MYATHACEFKWLFKVWQLHILCLYKMQHRLLAVFIFLCSYLAIPLYGYYHCYYYMTLGDMSAHKSNVANLPTNVLITATLWGHAVTLWEWYFYVILCLLSGLMQLLFSYRNWT